jgi:tetratricopeptide (TPR) repeat protein
MCTLFLLCIFAFEVQAQDAKYILKPFKKTKIKLYHLEAEKNIKEDMTIRKGTLLGKMQPLPEMISSNTKNDSLIKEAMGLYDSKNYSDAVKILETIYDEEKENLIYLNTYARTLFWMKGQEFSDKSFKIYSKLIDTIDTIEKTEKDVVVIDLWYAEAYWKLGCLYLDRGDYAKAAYEITRFMLYMPAGEEYIKLHDQVYSYLTEAFYYLENAEYNGYYFRKTMEVNPENTYVRRFKLKSDSVKVLKSESDEN